MTKTITVTANRWDDEQMTYQSETHQMRVSDDKPPKAPCFKCGASELKLYAGDTMLGLMCYGCDGVWPANERPKISR